MNLHKLKKGRIQLNFTADIEETENYRQVTEILKNLYFSSTL